MKLHAQHYRAIDAAMADVKTICQTQGTGKPALDAIRARLMQLACNTEFFNAQALPPPSLDDKANNVLYRLYEEDGGLALYANAANGRFYETPVHNHKTWAVLAGVEGIEINLLFAHTDDGGIRQTGQEALRQGTSLAFEDEDLHAIRIEAPLLNFHLYGVGLERQTGRQFYDAAKKAWVYFAASPNIVEAREHRAG